jgi:hypothetical protein
MSNNNLLIGKDPGAKFRHPSMSPKGEEMDPSFATQHNLLTLLYDAYVNAQWAQNPEFKQQIGQALISLLQSQGAPPVPQQGAEMLGEQMRAPVVGGMRTNVRESLANMALDQGAVPIPGRMDTAWPSTSPQMSGPADRWTLEKRRKP